MRSSGTSRSIKRQNGHSATNAITNPSARLDALPTRLTSLTMARHLARKYSERECNFLNFPLGGHEGGPGSESDYHCEIAATPW
jgi:hypothetical protein